MIRYQPECQPLNECRQQSRVLIVGCDDAVHASLLEYLEDRQFDVSVEASDAQAVRRITTDNPDAVVLRVSTNGLDGNSICRSIRPHYAGVILVVADQDDEVDEVLSFEFGADDFLTLPVKRRVLVARLDRHLRRSRAIVNQSAKGGVVRVGSLTLFPSQLLAELDEQPLELTTSEFELLLLLAENAGRTIDRDQISHRLHGVPYDGRDRSLDLRVSRLRKKLGDDARTPQRIKSVRGVGYMLACKHRSDAVGRSAVAE